MIDWKEKLVERDFTYHKPTTEQIEKMQRIRNVAKQLAELIADSTPENYEQIEAWKSLRNCVMWANASIVCEELTV